MKSNAIAHFEALTREKDAFDQATMQADRERSRIQARLQELGMRKEHFELESRKLSDAVGQFDNRKKDYTNEKARLKQVIQQERIALEQCAKQTEDALAQERARKHIFCQEMTSRNDELSRLLLQREDMRLSELIHVQTVTKIQAQQNTNECRTPTTNKEELEGAIEKLSDATNRAKSVLAEKKMLEGKVQELRRLALERATNAAGMNAGDNANSAMVRPIQPLTETSLLDLEALWGEAPQTTGNDGDKESADESATGTSHESPIHMQLFYGAHHNDNTVSPTEA